MKLSVFQETIKALPEGTEEKRLNAKFASKPYLPKEIEVSNMDDLIKVLTSNSWSPSLFKGHRKTANFSKTDFMVLDIDDGLTVQEACDVIDTMGVYALIMATTSHTEENHRFRVIFPLSTPITNTGDFSKTWDYLSTYFPSLDANCKDPARFYFGCKDKYVIFDDEGLTMLDPVKVPESEKKKIGKFLTKTVKVKDYTTKDILNKIYPDHKNIKDIPKSLDVFLTIGPEGGINSKGEKLWWRSLNDFCFTLSLMGKELNDIHEIVASIAPEELDDFDLEVIENAYCDGETYRE